LSPHRGKRKKKEQEKRNKMYCQKKHQVVEREVGSRVYFMVVFVLFLFLKKVIKTHQENKPLAGYEA